MKWVYAAFLLISYVSLCSCQQDCFGEGLAPQDPQPEVVAKGADVFSLSLFKDIAASYPFNSIVLSPYSVWSVLNLAYYGANGSTSDQLRKTLGVNSKNDAFFGGKIVETNLRLNKGTTFNKADKAYFATDIELKQCALDKLVEVESVDFTDSQAAAAKINQDVSDATRRKINNFLSPGIIANARFVLINAVYFKGNWTFPFPEGSTVVRPFYDEGRKVNISSVKMMSTTAKLRYVESEALGAGVLELPYVESNISMFIILPNFDKPSVNDVLKRLTSDALDEVTANFKERQVTVTLPRFKMTTRIADELKTALQKLGVKDLFDPKVVDLSNFVTKEKVRVDDALHHATIEVTEEGTVASAVTSLVATRSGPGAVVNFNAERPFIFLIRDYSQGLTLFMGVYRNPSHTIPF